jgi:hypothetical protein
MYRLAGMLVTLRFRQAAVYSAASAFEVPCVQQSS